MLNKRKKDLGYVNLSQNLDMSFVLIEVPNSNPTLELMTNSSIVFLDTGL